MAYLENKDGVITVLPLCGLKKVEPEHEYKKGEQFYVKVEIVQVDDDGVDFRLLGANEVFGLSLRKRTMDSLEKIREAS